MQSTEPQARRYRIETVDSPTRYWCRETQQWNNNPINCTVYTETQRTNLLLPPRSCWVLASTPSGRPKPQPSTDITIKHRYEPSRITPGRCGASRQVSAGHFQCCGKPEGDETHNQAHCPVCHHHFTPNDEPLCPRCDVYAPEAFEVIVRRLKAARDARTAAIEKAMEEQDQLSMEVVADFRAALKLTKGPEERLVTA